MPASLRICQIVEGATVMPSPASSPWIRRYPHDSFSRASRSTADRTLRLLSRGFGGQVPGGPPVLSWVLSPKVFFHVRLTPRFLHVCARDLTQKPGPCAEG